MKGIKIKKGTNDKVSLEFTSRNSKTLLEYDGDNLLHNGEMLGGNTTGITDTILALDTRKLVLTEGLITDVLDSVQSSKFNTPAGVLYQGITDLANGNGGYKNFTIEFDSADTYSAFNNNPIISCRRADTSADGYFRVLSYMSGNLTLSAWYNDSAASNSYSYSPQNTPSRFSSFKVVYTSNDTTSRFYKDGILVNTGIVTFPNTILTGLDKWSIGCGFVYSTNSATGNSYNGFMRNVKITIEDVVVIDLPEPFESTTKIGTGTIVESATGIYESIY